MSDLEMRAMKTEIFAIKNRRCFLNGRSRVSRSVSHDFEFLQVRSRSARLRYTLFTRLTCLRLITDLFYQWKSFDTLHFRFFVQLFGRLFDLIEGYTVSYKGEICFLHTTRRLSSLCLLECVGIVEILTLL
jgi:hypothetical protein